MYMLGSNLAFYNIHTGEPFFVLANSHHVHALEQPCFFYTIYILESNSLFCKFALCTCLGATVLQYTYWSATLCPCSSASCTCLGTTIFYNIHTGEQLFVFADLYHVHAWEQPSRPTLCTCLGAVMLYNIILCSCSSTSAQPPIHLVRFV